ncbi:PP2C family protein-serine/threonine phosphatase [Nocardioides sp.]|uniref:PP2C family protein-serine/threonine phosphatase n=1 Tax=Nocardioides sp. TaxID=35761 RepID=UPI002D7E6118|nr:PP2C family protein-serine/threonine phosphatase [Nocardioides sp.]HET8961213.1 PP2C family protein-serine/threonine phosphatase [Nocardioides sp.]
MSSRRWFRAGEVLIPLGVLFLLVVTDALLPPSLLITGTFALAVGVASVLTTVTRTALLAVAALVMAGVSALWNQNLGTTEWWIRMVVVAAGGALAVLVAWLRARRDRQLQHMTAIAEAAQRALLRAMPGSIGSLGLAARYVSATEEALVGGDLYEVADTPNGVRLVVGDVRGKGLDAVQLASTVLAAFRRAARLEPSLTEVAADLDEVVTAVAGDEDFVTVVLAEFHEDLSVTLLNCGHHPPLLVPDARSRSLVDTGTPQPPLGLHPEPSPTTCQLTEGERLLFYTDGLVESRDRDGTFFPLEESSAMSASDLGVALDDLLGQVVDHVGTRVSDDLALVLVERRNGAWSSG